MSRKAPLAVRLYRGALWMLPTRFRRERGAAMLAMLEEEWGERRSLGRAALLATALLDLMRTGVLERMKGSDARSGPARSHGGFSFSWLDVKLGLRMVFKQPGLTLVAVFALSIGIPASLIPWHVYDVLRAPLPFEGGERIIGIETRSIADRRVELRSLHDFFLWREEVASIESLAATRSDPYNVISSDGRVAPVRGAEMTASGFRALRVAPLAGRALLDADEVPGAPDVVVIGYDLWQSRLGGAPDAVGSTIRIGSVPHQVVGIMPQGFLFPHRDFLWLPFRHQPTDYERGSGPDVRIFGRLADGVSREQAQAEVSALGLRIANEFPETHQQLRPRVRSYTAMVSGAIDADAETSPPPELYLAQLIVLALLALVCGNVGTMILARNATRSGEIATRAALGASRGRIVSQLFVESLVLAVAAAGFGLFLGDVVANRFANSLFLEAPFWYDFGVTPKTIGIALSLAVFCAVIAGVLPAIKATGRGLQSNLQRANAGAGIRFGAGATILIVAEVALSVAFVTLGGSMTRSLLSVSTAPMVIEPSDYLMAMVRIPWTDYSAVENNLGVAEFRAQVAQMHGELARRVAAEPGVRGMAMGSNLPGMPHNDGRVEVEGEDLGEGFIGHHVRYARVDVGFFDGLGAPVLNGRGFSTADLAGSIGRNRTSVIVNSAFVDNILGGGNPIGRRVRYLAEEGEEPGPWYEIIGVVGELGMNYDGSVSDVASARPTGSAGLYHPIAPGELHPLWVAVHVGGDPLSFTPRLREITNQVDPDAMVQYPVVLRDAPNSARAAAEYGTLLLAFLAGVAIVLASAGLYALMSFTVAQRTREIGIRTALGARPERILGAIARRAFFQLVAGILAGLALAVWLLAVFAEVDALWGTGWPLMLATISFFVLVVGMLACVAPTLRGLRIRPVEALKAG